MPANYVFTQSPYKQLIISNLHTFLIFISILCVCWSHLFAFMYSLINNAIFLAYIINICFLCFMLFYLIFIIDKTL